MDELRIEPPLTETLARSLCAGQPVRISGVVYAARDAAHARMVQALDRGERLPFDPAGALIYYVGPTPGHSGQIVGSAGPTTSERMDAYTPRLFELGVRGTIGKGERTPAVVEAMRRHGAVYFAAIGGAGALLGRAIVSAEVVAYPDLGTEALRKLVVKDFPAWVAQDAQGGSIFRHS